MQDVKDKIAALVLNIGVGMYGKRVKLKMMIPRQQLLGGHTSLSELMILESLTWVVLTLFLQIP